MFLSNLASPFLAVCLIALSGMACGWLETADNTGLRPQQAPSSKYPFKTKEPDDFQCEIVETSGDVVRRIRLARKGEWRRIDRDAGATNERTFLTLDREFVIDPARRVYWERPQLAGNTVEPRFNDLTHELLTAGPRTSFEELGREGSVVKYKAINENAQGEVIIYYDTAAEMIVKQEFLSIENNERSLQYTVEIKDLKVPADDRLFVLPAGYTKISKDEMNRIK